MSASYRTISILVPVYNEISYLEQVIKRLQAVDLLGLEKEIILVDDGSNDGSTQYLADLKARQIPGYLILLERENRGKGAALRTAIAVASGDIIVIQDADLEYDPADYPPLLAEIVSGRADVVYGSRFSGLTQPGAFGRLHYMGNQFLSLCTRLLYNTTITDMETCYKAFRGPLLKQLKLEADRFDFEPEVTAKVLRAGWRLKELPISYSGRSRNKGKKITWRDGFAALFTLIKFRFKG